MNYNTDKALDMGEELIELVDQLSKEQQNDLLKRLLANQAQQRPLTIEEKLKLLDAVKLDIPINEEPSIRRVDWCDGLEERDR